MRCWLGVLYYEVGAGRRPGAERGNVARPKATQGESKTTRGEGLVHHQLHTRPGAPDPASHESPRIPVGAIHESPWAGPGKRQPASQVVSPAPPSSFQPRFRHSGSASVIPSPPSSFRRRPESSVGCAWREFSFLGVPAPARISDWQKSGLECQCGRRLPARPTPASARG